MGAQAIDVLTLNRVATATITAKTFATAAGGVAGAGANTFGVWKTGGASGDRLPVTVLGTATVLSGAAVTKDSAVKSDAAGKAIDRGGSGIAAGIALEAATGANQEIEVLLLPNGA